MPRVVRFLSSTPQCCVLLASALVCVMTHSSPTWNGRGLFCPAPPRALSSFHLEAAEAATLQPRLGPVFCCPYLLLPSVMKSPRIDTAHLALHHRYALPTDSTSAHHTSPSIRDCSAAVSCVLSLQGFVGRPSLSPSLYPTTQAPPLSPSSACASNPHRTRPRPITTLSHTCTPGPLVLTPLIHPPRPSTPACRPRHDTTDDMTGLTACSEPGATRPLDRGLDHAVRLVNGQEDVRLAGVVAVLDAELGQVHRDIVDVGLTGRAEESGQRQSGEMNQAWVWMGGVCLLEASSDDRIRPPLSGDVVRSGAFMSVGVCRSPCRG